jgi:glucosyl-3-phosphoglycerate synthase
MISVIIPAMNEEKTIGQVVKASLEETLVTEVIVVDDRSEDGTMKLPARREQKLLSAIQEENVFQ